jgi:hypothetical protein
VRAKQSFIILFRSDDGILPLFSLTVQLRDQKNNNKNKMEGYKFTYNTGACLLACLLTYVLIPWCRILFEKLIVTLLIKKCPAFFMEPEGSSQCSQKPATGPYPEPAESSSPHRSLFP